MKRESVLKLLKAKLTLISSLYDVKRLSLFGSVATDEARDDSDVDLLVEFEHPATFDHYMELKFYLEELLHQPVDLVTNNALKPRMRTLIEKEVVHVS